MADSFLMIMTMDELAQLLVDDAPGRHVKIANLKEWDKYDIYEVETKDVAQAIKLRASKSWLNNTYEDLKKDHYNIYQYCVKCKYILNSVEVEKTLWEHFWDEDREGTLTKTEDDILPKEIMVAG